jgi:hypothetical protein
MKIMENDRTSPIRRVESQESRMPTLAIDPDKTRRDPRDIPAAAARKADCG